MSDNGVTITRMSSRGIWIKAQNQKFFLSYYIFPWFKNKTVQAVMDIEQPSPDHFHWPQLNLTIDLNRIRQWQHHPLQETASPPQSAAAHS